MCILFFFFLFLFLGCSRYVRVQEGKLLGSWQLDTPSKSGLIYTYNKDHTYTITLAGEKHFGGFATHGRWELTGDVLISDEEFASNTNTTARPINFPVNSEKVTIFELSDSIMVWGSNPLSGKFTLRRVKTLAP